MNEIYTDLETLESFIRCEWSHNKIGKETTKELLRLIQEIKDKTVSYGTN